MVIYRNYSFIGLFVSKKKKTTGELMATKKSNSEHHRFVISNHKIKVVSGALEILVNNCK